MKNCYIACFILFIVINSGYAQSVIVGQQVWSIKNLDVSHFQNGDPIPEAKSDAEFVFAYFWVRDSYVMLGYDSHDRYWDEMGDDDSFGFSVRCVED